MANKRYGADRIDFIEKVEAMLKKRVERLQSRFYAAIKDHFESELTLTNGAIKSTLSNYNAIYNLGLFNDAFKKKEINPLLRWIAKTYVKVVSMNDKYFDQTADLKDVNRAAIRNNLLAQKGLKIVENKVKILSGGWVDSLSNLENPYRKVQEMAINAAASGIEMKVFRKSLTESAKDTGSRSLVNHFRTNAYDGYAQFDRTLQKDFADKLGLKAFIYEGGLVDNSREWCKSKNSSVFLVSETEGWRNKTWKGKNKDYEPLRDMGGHNCGHHPSFISIKLAIALRPDIKDLIESLG